MKIILLKKKFLKYDQIFLRQLLIPRISNKEVQYICSKALTDSWNYNQNHYSNIIRQSTMRTLINIEKPDGHVPKILQLVIFLWIKTTPVTSKHIKFLQTYKFSKHIKFLQTYKISVLFPLVTSYHTNLPKSDWASLLVWQPILWDSPNRLNYFYTIFQK
jgi:hypothetical protein